MANTIHNGGTGEWTTAGNWSNGVPTDANGAQIPGSVNVNITVGSDQSGIDTPYIYVDRGFNKDLGASGQPLEIATGIVKWLGGPQGRLYLKSGHATAQVDLCLIDCDNMTDGFNLESDGTGRFDNIRIRKGKGTIAGNMTTMALVRTDWRDNRAADVDLTIAAGAGTVTLGVFNGGKITSSSASTTLLINGAHYIHAVGAGAITTLYQTAGFTEYKAVQNITNLHVHGGEFDMREVPGVLTVTNLYTSPGSIVRAHALLTVTNDFSASQTVIYDDTL